MESFDSFDDLSFRLLTFECFHEYLEPITTRIFVNKSNESFINPINQLL
ncbi:hypothetical protein CLV33_10617 [Jejuia pallidilutea]|uniref:Uncharacterized protein n=1 Tax=Jejuia pallidilutea TaxID=504487 RepID=A0A362XAY1_9FLAO|nr:hypothetical protein CLV33_10617 [Jejuia pallidilutea]